MLQIEEWFRRPQRKTERKAASVTKPTASAVHKTEDVHPQATVKKEIPVKQTSEETAAEFTPEPKSAASQNGNAVTEEVAAVPETTEAKMPEETVMTAPEKEVVMPETEDQALAEVPENDAQVSLADEAEDMFEPEDPAIWKQRAAETQESVSLQDSVAETDELEHISEKIGQDVSGMIDMEKEDFLLQQIDEFREKAKQLQQLMQSRETKAKELQGVVDERQAKASELDSLIQVRRGEADKIMDNVTERIDAMSAGVRNEMSGLSDTVSRQVSGLSQNLSYELNQSTEKTRQVVEAATQNMIDQNTRSLEGLKEQLDQLGHLEQIGELYNEMNSQISTLKTDIADKIHAEDVKCYRNIQASMDEQSKLLSEGDEQTRQHIQEQVDNLSRQMRSKSKLAKVSLTFTILNFLGIVGILAYLVLF